MLVMWGIHGEVEASDASVGYCSVQWRKRGGDTAVDRRQGNIIYFVYYYPTK